MPLAFDTLGWADEDDYGTEFRHSVYGSATRPAEPLPEDMRQVSGIYVRVYDSSDPELTIKQFWAWNPAHYEDQYEDWDAWANLVILLLGNYPEIFGGTPSAPPPQEPTSPRSVPAGKPHIRPRRRQ